MRRLTRFNQKPVPLIERTTKKYKKFVNKQYKMYKSKEKNK